jgi:hypothetical protein
MRPAALPGMRRAQQETDKCASSDMLTAKAKAHQHGRQTCKEDGRKGLGCMPGIRGIACVIAIIL